MHIRQIGDESKLTLGLLDEYTTCMRDGTPAEIYAATTESGDHLVILWLPQDGRAGISSRIGTGDDQWTDAKSVEHAINLYLAGEMNP